MYSWDFAALKPYWGLIWQGLLVTILYTVTTVIAGLAIGLVTGVLRTTAPRWVSIPLRGYIELFRCTPLLVQLVWVYYALPVLIGVEMTAATACFITLSLYAGSFMPRYSAAASSRSMSASGRPAAPSACAGIRSSAASCGRRRSR
jgi:polar amino acid transport system permease protein